MVSFTKKDMSRYVDADGISIAWSGRPRSQCDWSSDVQRAKSSIVSGNSLAACSTRTAISPLTHEFVQWFRYYERDIPVGDQQSPEGRVRGRRHAQNMG